MITDQSFTKPGRNSAALLLAAILLFMPVLLFAQGSAGSMRANISGTITVDRNLDQTGDFSGIGVAIVNFDAAAGGLDTLFYARTDRSGNFSGTARFSERDEYVISITRNERLISTSTVVLANGDHITITAEIPGFNESFRAQSRENNAVHDYRRVERNFNRVVEFISSGMSEVTQDTIPVLLRTWSDLFWSVNELHPGSLAAETSTLRSIEIMQGWDDALVLRRARQGIGSLNLFKSDRAILASDALLRLEGMDAAIAFVDSVQTLNMREEDRILLQMRKIEILAQFNQNEQALRMLRDFRIQFSDDPTLAQWADFYMYDIENLAPGMKLPDFELLLQDERTVTNDSYTGRYLLLEIANLASQRYQGEHALMRFLYEDVRSRVQFLTLPTNDSPITIRAFYDERPTGWPVAKARQVHNADLIRRLNVIVQPTRILVAPDGTIVRKYSGTEFSIIENDIRQLLNQTP
ncbi:MAG: hypothetical protein LAT75_02280 [Candidatus Cyclonatronum sp.]|uniref:TlpA family protein disulfide reductase n=1 Tax=Cyclonatronum sp. TaxID=3024185 RepID=UPI0025C25FBE|nr:hypothetical protein [Cyclonatronum sp.]MCC5934271.1 hypothetical protein [Balneolales bacterium]MCH8485662.1 hypothetical protein [Cyclonatronum sp.]